MSSLAQDPIAVSRERLGGIALRSAWNDLKAQKKGMRARDSADALGVSEAELIASLIGDTATRLGSLSQRLSASGARKAFDRPRDLGAKGFDIRLEASEQVRRLLEDGPPRSRIP